MSGWRSSKNRSRSSREPSLPGLLGPLEGSDRARVRRPSSPGEYALAQAQTRIGAVVLVFCVLFLVIAGRLTDLTLLTEAPEAPSARATNETSMASRADIVDRRGTIMATSLPTVSLSADAKRLLDPAQAVSKLREVLPELDEAKLVGEIKNAKRYVSIKRHLTPRQYYAINKMGIAGLEFQPDESRIYPAGALTSHVVGYTDVDNNGIAGLEKSMNARLEQNPEPLATSIDLRVQTILHSELQASVEEFHALGGAGIVMDAATGEILAMVSLPDFDPQKAGVADDNAKFNRATLGVYEMGSTFKTFNTAMALDSGLIKVTDKFDTMHAIEIGHQTIRDMHGSSHPFNVAEIYMESSNIGSARMVERLGTARQKAFLGKLGLLDKSTVELPEVGAPLLPSAANWGETATMTIAFGHGIAVNAVQLVGAAASIVEDGILVKPTLLKGNAKTAEGAGMRIISGRTSAQMRALMRLVVKHGTAKKAEMPGYLVGGKTGTADKLAGHRYSDNARMSSFIGVFPMSAPRYVVFAILDDPKGTAKTYGFATAGWTAAPVVGRVIGQIGPLLNMAPLETEVAEATEHQIFRSLGPEITASLHLDEDSDDYAAVESNRPQ